MTTLIEDTLYRIQSDGFAYSQLLEFTRTHNLPPASVIIAETGGVIGAVMDFIHARAGLTLATRNANLCADTFITQVGSGLTDELHVAKRLLELES